LSQRAIAKEVFGDARFHGRVERILGARPVLAAGVDGEPLESASVLPEGLQAPELRKLFRFYDEIRKRTGAEPSLADLERLLRIHVRLEAVAQLERLNGIVRSSGLDPKAFLDGLAEA
jgi:hypothetical protein